MYYQFIITYKFLHKKSNIAEKYSFKNRNSEEKNPIKIFPWVFYLFPKFLT